MATFSHLTVDGLTMLGIAEAEARKLGYPPWHLAVEIQTLEAAGLHAVALRWLIHQDLLSHFRDLDPAPEGAGLTFDPRSRFVFTEKGRVWCADMLAHSPRHTLETGGRTILTPSWNKNLRELWFAGLLVKAFERGAPAQERMYQDFQEVAWNVRMDDPLPPRRGLRGSGKMRYLAERMTKSLDLPVLRFFADGTGTAICWCLADPLQEESATEARRKRDTSATEVRHLEKET